MIVDALQVGIPQSISSMRYGYLANVASRLDDFDGDLDGI
jgi:hypothetical protein